MRKPHIFDPDFGDSRTPLYVHSIDTIDTEIRRLTTIAQKLTPVEVNFYLIDRYETAYGIRNHDVDQDNSFGIFAFNECEDSMKNSLLYERSEEFVQYKVGEHFKMSWLEFMELPHEYCNMLIEISKKKVALEASVVSQVANQLNNFNMPKK